MKQKRSHLDGWDVVTTVIALVFFVLAVLVEKVFGLYGLMFACSIFVLQMQRFPSLVLVVLVIGSLIADVVFLRPIGMTGSVLIVTLLVWMVVRPFLRVRIASFMILGILMQVILARIDKHIMNDKNTIFTLLVLFGGWSVLRLLFLSSTRKHVVLLKHDENV